MVAKKPDGTGRDAKAAANWIINELAGRLNKEGKDIAASPVSASQLGAILDLIAAGTISGKIAKDLFEICWSEGGDPHAIVEARGMRQVTDVVGDREGGRRHHRRERRQGGAGEGEARTDRLVRRSGDEGLRRQGQPAGGERAAQGQARHLKTEHSASETAERGSFRLSLVVRHRRSSDFRSSVVRLRANHFAPIRSISRLESTAAERVHEPLDRKFFHKPLGMLNASSPQRFQPRARPRTGVFRRARKKSRSVENPYFSVFSKSSKKSRTFLRDAHCATRRARRKRSTKRNIWCRCACEHTPLCENTGFFVAL